ncbi:MAG: aldehyde dehydrogenase family protein [Planctomycetota bacterium]
MTETLDGRSSMLGDATAVMSAARAAAREWRAVPVAERASLVGRLRCEVVGARADIARTICGEAGKTEIEALLSDILPTLEILRYLEEHAAGILRSQARRTPFIYRASRSHVEYRPRGVVLVIAPWNNPLQLALVPAASALVAGNAVILKPSERTPATGALVGQLCERAGLTSGQVRIAAGGPDVARALIDERPDMVFFTGGPAGGRAVLAAAAQHLIPVVLELGGKDPMIVFADADLDRAARAAVYGAFAHAGQHCISTKRLYVDAAIHDAFLARVADETRRVSATGDWGRATDARGLDAAREQVREALASGARLLAPDDESKAGAEPTLLADVTHAMRIAHEETFAPVLAAMPFADEAEAVRLANDTPFGLNASVWSRDLARARRVVEGLETGNAYINNVLINAGNPTLPFGGVKASGFGRNHGPEGIRAFCTETSVMECTSSQAAEPHWFPHDEAQRGAADELIALRHDGRGPLKRLWGWLRLLWKL